MTRYVLSKFATCENFGNDSGTVVGKCSVDVTIGNDADVVTKPPPRVPFGNDLTDVLKDVLADVVSKRPPWRQFGNDVAMFVRVRRRTLKGGHPEWRKYRKQNRSLVTASASYDVVRAVRIDGKPRQNFLFGLGSLKEHRTDFDLIRFWIDALHRMQRHGLDEQRRRQLINAMVRKGATKPSRAQCDEFAEAYKNWSSQAERAKILAELFDDEAAS